MVCKAIDLCEVMQEDSNLYAYLVPVPPAERHSHHMQPTRGPMGGARNTQ
ncbi:hypothetical protein HanIR_Chr02g0052111 [Helianthus annuus]|nr:hypothetical protein HanIR_Chr02g0052111 [Helianthus annuus]